MDEASFAKGAMMANLLTHGIEGILHSVKETIEEFPKLVGEVAEAGKEIIETAQATGLTTDALQQLRDVFGEAGVSAQAFDVSIFRLSRSLNAAKKGAGAQSEAFSKLHVKVTDGNGKLRQTDDVLMDLAERFSKMPDGPEKTALAMEFFGRQGARLIPVLNKGKETLAALREEQTVMTKEQLEAGKELKESQYALGLVVRNFWRQTIGPILPALSQLVKRFLEWRRAHAAILAQRMQWVMSGLVTVIKAVGDAVAFLAKNFKAVEMILGGAGLIYLMTTFGNVSVIAAAKTLASWALALAPFLAIAAAIAAILLIYDDLRVYNEDQKRADGKVHSMWGTFLQKVDEFYKDRPKPAALQHFIDFVNTLRDAGKFMTEFSKSFEDLIDYVANNLDKVAAVGNILLGAFTGDKAAMATGIAQGVEAKKRIAASPGQAMFDSFWSGNTKGTANALASASAAGPMAFSPYSNESPEFRAGMEGQRVIMNSPVNIQVTTQPGQSNEEIGRFVLQHIEDHHDSLMERTASGVLK